jgi:D-alanyl-D-alanine carboxypeptidase
MIIIVNSNPNDASWFRLISVLTLMFLALGAATGAAQIVLPTAEGLAELDRWIEAHLEEHKIPGALVAVAPKGRMIHLKSYGMANVELSVPVSDRTVFEIGSISKQFASAVAMLLVEEERLGLDDSIHQYLPDLPSEWHGVTVRQLLTHTSGIPDYEEIRSYDVYANFSRFPGQDAAVIVFMNRYRVDSNPMKLAVLHTFMSSLGPIP